MCYFWCVSAGRDLVGQLIRTSSIGKTIIYPLPFLSSRYPLTLKCKAAGLFSHLVMVVLVLSSEGPASCELLGVLAPAAAL